MRNPYTPRQAFSLIEILVVLGVASLMGAVVLGGFSSYQGSQRRSTCQSNMVQIYRAARLYSNDNGSFPPPYIVTGQTQLSGGLGLLWAQPDIVNGVYQNTGLKAPEEAVSYLKTPNALHCPSDGGPNVPQTPFNIQGQVDLAFLSYQKVDSRGGDNNGDLYDGNVPTANKDQSYLPRRTQIAGDPDFVRQLDRTTYVGTQQVRADVPIPSNTVITWCQFHRGASKRPDTVLFFDGSVRRMEVEQESSCSPGHSSSLTGWRRVSECATPGVAANEGAGVAQKP